MGKGLCNCDVGLDFFPDEVEEGRVGENTDE